MGNMFKSHHWHFLIMILCFIYGGVSLLFFIFQMTPIMNPEEGTLPFERMVFENQTGPFPLQEYNDSQRNNSYITAHERDRVNHLRDRVTSYVYITSAVSLIGSFISILAGISLLVLMRKKERKEIKKSVFDKMTTPEEKQVINTLEIHNGELTQSELVKETKIAKVKMHRIIKHLEQLKIIEKFPYGMTNKIVLYTKSDEEKK